MGMDILRQNRILKSGRQQSNYKDMMGRVIRQLFAIVIATMLIGVPTVQATITMPCDAVVTIASDYHLSAGSAPTQTPVPCKGMMPGCTDMFGCAVTAGLPAHVTGTAHKLIWTSVAYRAAIGWHEGLSIKPYLGPPITIWPDSARRALKLSNCAAPRCRRGVRSAAVVLNHGQSWPDVSRTQREHGPENGYLEMKYIVMAAITAFALGTAANAHAENPRSSNSAAQPVYSGTESSAASLTGLLAEWDQAGFDAPSKPGQYRVYGQDGYVTNGPGYNYIVSLIRAATNDVRSGKDHDAATKIAKARSLLAANNLGKEWDMENPSSSRALALFVRRSNDSTSQHRYGALAYLRGHKGSLLVGAALGVIAFIAGWRWFGTGAVLPLLYILPCLAMTAMCMLGGGGSGNTPTAPDNSTGSGPDASQWTSKWRRRLTPPRRGKEGNIQEIEQWPRQTGPRAASYSLDCWPRWPWLAFRFRQRSRQQV
jgi:hypothetical protein